MKTMTWPNRTGLVLAIMAAMMLGAFACAPATTQITPTPLLTQNADIPPLPEQNPGSLFNPASAEMLFADNRARRVGDIVMISIEEKTEAKNKATTDASRDSSVGLGIEHLLSNQVINAGLPLAGLNRDDFGETELVKAASKSAFKGDGETKRESKITATIGARVVRVLNGGVMQVEGAREIRVNNETQIIVIRGLVRSTDIRPDNTIPSTHMADATIEFYGAGVVADKQRPGWLTRLLDNVWPF